MSELAPLHLAPRFRRSVQLAHDYGAGTAALDDYQATPLVVQVLSRIVAGLDDENPSRAWSIIGPYGTGKSAFGIFLAHFVQATAPQRQTLLSHHSTSHHRTDIKLTAPRLLPVLVSGNNSSLRTALLAATRAVVPNDALHSEIELALANQKPDPVYVTALLERASAAVAAQTGYAGILFVVDELGQFLDYAAQNGSDNDVFVLQTMAEMTTRTTSSVCTLVTILHQAFDRYSPRTSDRQRTEWAKVQGRFADVPFQEPATQLMRMLGRALAAGQTVDPTMRRAWAVAVSAESERLELRPADMEPHEWVDLLADVFPLHPTVLLVLPRLFRQLAQNERSLFAFLASTEPGSLQDVAQIHGSNTIYRLPHIFAYIENTLGIGLFNHARGRRWAELAEARLRLAEPQRLLDQVLTTIGTLGALSQSQLRASETLLSYALTDTADSADVLNVLQQLEQRQFITYRKHRGSWVLWEGSDLNLDGLVQQALRIIQPTLSLVELLRQHADVLPLVARRHSYQTGAMRMFPFNFVAAADLPTLPATAFHDGGEIICVVAQSDEETVAVHHWLDQPERTTETARIVIVPRQIAALREILLDVASLRHVLHTEDALHHDAPARRELASRLAEAVQILDALLAQLTSVAVNQWWWCGQRQPLASVQQREDLLSTLCDTLFHATPHVWNELVVRRQITSMSAKARRNLIESMVTTAPGEPLTFTGTPPERAIYESIVRTSGIFRANAEGSWEWNAPPPADPAHLLPVWQAMQIWLEQSSTESRSVDTLYTVLEAPPYGVKAGLQPLLLVAFYLAQRGSVALYEHGSFVPVPDVPAFERLLRQPAQFALRLSRVEGARVAVYQRIAQALAPQLLAQPTPQLMYAVAPLLAVVRRLPEWSRQTRSVSITAQAIRAALAAARAPDLLLFDELPLACGLPPFSPEGYYDQATIDLFFSRLREGLTELQNAYPTLIQTALDVWAMAFQVHAADAATVQAELVARYDRIAPLVHETNLRTLGNRLTQTHTANGWIESIGALVCRKPLPQWSDDDLAAFRLHSSELARRFRQVEELALANQVLPAATPLVRVSLTTPQGEQSRVVVQTNWNEPMQQLHDTLAATLANTTTLSNEQQVAVLAEILNTGPNYGVSSSFQSKR